MKRKITIHCGVPKTGSSALQVQLARSKETFLSHGYDYPAFGATQAAKAGGITSGNGIVLASTYFPDGLPARSGQSRARETERIRRHIAQSDNHTLLSSEFLLLCLVIIWPCWLHRLQIWVRSTWCSLSVSRLTHWRLHMYSRSSGRCALRCPKRISKSWISPIDHTSPRTRIFLR